MHVDKTSPMNVRFVQSQLSDVCVDVLV